MKFFLASVTLCVASAIAVPAPAPLGQIETPDSNLCPGATKGSVWTDSDGKEFKIYCGTVYSGDTVHGTNAGSFKGCIHKCTTWNKDHGANKTCAGVSYSFQASPQCELYATGFSAAKAIGVKSAAVFTGKGTPDGTFEKLALPLPHNWIASLSLFPGDVIAQYNGHIKDYNSSSWADHVLKKCKGFKACTSTLTFAADNSGSTGGRFWFGTVYRGGATTVADYTRALDQYNVQHSVAYTIVE